MKWLPGTMTAVATVTLMNTGAMAQSLYSYPDSNRVASIAQRFDVTERDWQHESKPSASGVKPTNPYARPSDTRADAEQMWRDKFVAHAMETGDVANAAVNTPRFERRAPADPIAPLASMNRAEQDAYYMSIESDAKP